VPVPDATVTLHVTVVGLSPVTVAVNCSGCPIVAFPLAGETWIDGPPYAAVTVVFAVIVTLHVTAGLPEVLLQPDQPLKVLLPEVAGAVSTTFVPDA
jgi:hypothetical protein